MKAQRFRQAPEGAIVRTILDGLASYRIPAFRLNSGAYKQRDGAFLRFGFPGCPDIVALLPRQVLWIECKSARGTLSPAQVEFRNLCLARGIRHCVAKS